MKHLIKEFKYRLKTELWAQVLMVLAGSVVVASAMYSAHLYNVNFVY